MVGCLYQTHQLFHLRVECFPVPSRGVYFNLHNIFKVHIKLESDIIPNCHYSSTKRIFILRKVYVTMFHYLWYFTHL